MLWLKVWGKEVMLCVHTVWGGVHPLVYVWVLNFPCSHTLHCKVEFQSVKLESQGSTELSSCPAWWADRGMELGRAMRPRWETASSCQPCRGKGGQERNQADKDELKVLQWINSHPEKHGSPGQALLLANIYSVGAASCWLTASAACLQSSSPGTHTQLSSPAKGEGSTPLLLHTPLELRFKDKYYLPSDVLTIF